MGKTNLGLVEHCKKALKEGWYYLWGAYGQIATQSVLDSNIRQYSSNEKWRSYAQGAIGKTRFCDCYGLVKSYLWWANDSSNPKYSSVHDRNTAQAYVAAKEKGALATLPEIPGIILYMTGHVGVYIGSGRFIECAGGGTGMFEGKITNGKVIRGSKFTHWFKDVSIEYVTAKEDTEVVDTTKIKIDGKIYTVNRVLIGDRNHVELQSLIQAGFKVDFDSVNKMPVITSPKN